MKAERGHAQEDDHAENGVMSEAVVESRDPPAAKPKAKKAAKRPSKPNTQRPAKKKKESTESKPLSTEELIQLKETEQQYHTSLLRMQEDDHAENGVMSEAVVESRDPPAAKPKAKKAAKRPSKPNTQRPAKKKKESTESKPLSTEELIQLKETEQQYHTSLLRMQIDELLQEVRLKDKRRKSIEEFIQEIRDLIEKIPPTPETDLVDQSWLPESVKVPFLQLPYNVKGKFHFVPPTSIKVLGSFLLGTCIRPEINVDVAVTMPQEILQAKDNLNQRYLRKRALYLAHMAARLAESNIFSSVKFAYVNSNHMKPVLLLRPHGKDEKMVTVRIHVCLPPEVFKFNRFSPSKNNVRVDWFRERKKKDTEEGANEPPTPHYNNTVLCDLAMEQHFYHLSSCLSDFPGMKDGISVLKVWLRQRQLDKGYGGFNGFVASMLVAYLLSKNKINKAMNGNQVLRNTLQFLASTDLTVNGITMSKSTDSSLPSIEDFHRAFGVVFVDPLGVVNLCADMTAATYKQIQFEAKESIRILDDTSANGFLLILMTPKPFVRTFDHVFHITSVDSLQKSCKKMKLSHELMDRGGDYVSTALPFILSILKKGLDQRVVLLSHALLQKPEWDITEKPARPKDIGSLTLGLMLTPDFFSSVLEKGHAADNPEAADFRSFWGGKSELRRFQDASICEAVVWPASNLEEKRHIPELITRHLLSLHADVSEEAITYSGNLLDCVLNKGKKAGTGEERLASVIQSYDDLSRKLWNLEDLPLTVTAVQGTHPALRYTDVFPPVPVKPDWSCYKKSDRSLVPSLYKPSPAYVSPIKVICHMEGSGKWPQDKDAIKRVKAAFQIRLAELLKDQHELLCKPSTTHTDVYKDGYVFRLQVAYHREPQFMKEYIAPDKILKSRDTEESLKLELETLHLPHLTSTLHGLHQQLPAFGGTSRLAKRWISAQLLDGCVSDECVDLLVAYLFLHPVPFTAPSSPQVGFLRFLNLLASYDWKNSPLVVNLNGELTDADLIEIQSDFTSARTELPVMFIATPKDRKVSVWTKEKPTAQFLQRLIILASESLLILEKQLMQPLKSNDIKMIFRPPLDLYDVLIHLDPKHIPRHRETVDQPPKSFFRGILKETAPVNFSCFPVVDYDPVQLYLSELRESYGEFALFFYDGHGGEVIGVIWNPSSFTPQPFRMTKVNGRIVDTKSNSLLLIPNVEAILEDFKILGEGLVKSVECQSERWNI